MNGSGLRWLLLIIAIVGNARIAEATCGDYLGGHGKAMTRHVTATLLDSLGTVPREPVPFPHCSGPNCHRNDPVPAPNPERPVPTSTDAILIPVLDLPGPDRQVFRRNDQADCIPGSAGRIFRPPRDV